MGINEYTQVAIQRGNRETIHTAALGGWQQRLDREPPDVECINAHSRVEL